MAYSLTRSFNVFRTKSLLLNFFKPQCKRKILNIDYQTLSYKSSFVNMHCTLSYKSSFVKMQSSFMNFRSLFVSKPLTVEIKKVTITFVRHDGVQFKKVVPVGVEINTLFEWDGDEIPKYGMCGGIQDCATCHLKFPKHLMDKLKEPTTDELDTLVCANEYDVYSSRLGCCIEVTEEMDGAVIHVPEIVGDKRDKE